MWSIIIPILIILLLLFILFFVNFHYCFNKIKTCCEKKIQDDDYDIL